MRDDRKNKAELVDELRRLRAKLAAVVPGSAICTDENWRALDDLASREQRFRVIAAASRDLVTETDPEGRLTYINDACLGVLGYSREELVGTRPVDLHHEDDRDWFLDLLRASWKTIPSVHVGPHRLRHRGGHYLWFEATAVFYLKPSGERHTIGIARDISERIRTETNRRALEQRMQQVQKLEGLGVMAGGIAHDFNNLLTPILGDAALALVDLPEDSPIRERMKRIQLAANRAAALTDQMLTYTGQDVMKVEPLDLSAAAEEVVPLLEMAAGHETLLVQDFSADLPAISADRSRLSQVVMNLVLNASEALDGGRGCITLRTGVIPMARETLDRTLLGQGLPEGDYVFLEVEDNGCGMDSETIHRIFDPFFTTKFTGRGLGLATVLGILRGHDGTIDIQSEPGSGTRFRLFFPSAGKLHPAVEVDVNASVDLSGEGLVLVVDDDAGVREIVAYTLERAGYTVLEAKNGEQAIDLYRQHGDEVVLVLLDCTMPETSGAQTLSGIRGIDPDARVLLMSGYTRGRAVVGLPDGGSVGFLQKPFLPGELMAGVQALSAP
ncbi:MAG: PAS domain S-box protein [Deltaproteobacteria bacterium]|nr:PAS domain S-box protein [Deltaproteobacteria bacterium]MBW2447764.1 PAS domain S-box protein [Deltaproteobacteria bacterium]